MTYQTDAKLSAPKGAPSSRYRRHLKRLEAARANAELLAAGGDRVKPRHTYRSRPATLRGVAVTPIVYFVQAKKLGLVKIGSTTDLFMRLQSLQVGSPDILEIVGAMRSPHGLDIERDLHMRFDALREHGEWFRPEPELLAYIAEWPVERMEDEMSAENRDHLNAALCG